MNQENDSEQSGNREHFDQCHDSSVLDARSVLDFLPIGACVLSEDLKVHEWNLKLEEWTGLSKSEVIGSRLSDHFPNLLEPRYSGRLEQVFATGAPAKYSAALHKHFLQVPVRHGLDGIAGEFMVQETEVRLCSTEPKLAFCSIQDFSFQYGQVIQLKNERAELVAMQERLGRTNRRLRTRNEELDEFCYVASHDLQEPLNSLITIGQLMEQQSRELLDAQGLRCLDGMLDKSRKMRSIIIDLLALSRAGRTEPNTDRVSVKQAAEVALDLLDDKIYSHKAVVEFDNALQGKNSPQVIADEVLLAQVYQNLVANSLKFTPPNRKPVIRLTAERNGNWWQMGVEDNGQGIDEKNIEQVFRPFKRFSGGHDPDVGSGVGLTLCRKAIHQMGGQIEITSQPDVGSTVRFSLLAVDTAGQPSVEQDSMSNPDMDVANEH